MRSFNRFSDLLLKRSLGFGGAFENGVAALDVSADVLAAQLGQLAGPCFHGKHVVAANVDPAKQSDPGGHRTILFDGDASRRNERDIKSILAFATRTGRSDDPFHRCWIERAWRTALAANRSRA